jgi:hypothetical protein
MPRMSIAVSLVVSTLAAGCASERPAATAEAAPTSREAGEASPPDVWDDAGRPSPAHPSGTHAAWVQPSWFDEHPVATAAGSVAIGAGLAMLAGALLFLYALAHAH